MIDSDTPTVSIPVFCKMEEIADHLELAQQWKIRNESSEGLPNSYDPQYQFVELAKLVADRAKDVAIQKGHDDVTVEDVQAAGRRLASCLGLNY